MEDKKNIDLLSELKKQIPKSAFGFNATMYAIALEGWRRGLKLKFFTKRIKKKMKIRYSLSYKDKEHTFQFSLGDKVPKTATKLTKDKELTKQHLANSNIPVPKGKSFNSEHSIEEIVDYSKTLGYPLVAKPVNSSLGRGVVTNINDEKELRDALDYIRADLSHDDLLIEQCVTGEDTRVVVVDEKVVAAYKRIPANVVGDGENNIHELITMKNEVKAKHPHVHKHKIKVNNAMEEYLSKKGYSLDTVPDLGEKVYLSDSTLHLLAAETVDVTDKLSQKAKEVAINAAKSIPGMYHCGMDLMIDYNKNTVFVLEINSRPNLGGNLFPLVGKGRDIPKAMIDFYFPETVNRSMELNSHRLYFNFTKISNILKSGSVSEVIVPPHPKKEMVYKKITVSGKVQGVGFRKWIKRKAVGYNLNGYVKNLNNKDVRIIIAGEKSRVESFIDLLEDHNSKKFVINNLDIQNWEKAVRIGFEIKKTYKRKKINKTKIN